MRVPDGGVGVDVAALLAHQVPQVGEPEEDEEGDVAPPDHGVAEQVDAVVLAGEVLLGLRHQSAHFRHLFAHSDFREYDILDKDILEGVIETFRRW